MIRNTQADGRTELQVHEREVFGRELSILGGIAIVTPRESFTLFRISGNCSVKTLGIFGWKTIWEGNLAQATFPIQFKLPTAELIRLERGAESVMLTLDQSHPEEFGRPDWFTFRTIAKLIRDLSTSSALHIALIFAVLVIHGEIRLFHKKEAAAKPTEQKQEIPIDFSTVAQLINQEYAGKSISPRPESEAATPTKTVAKGLTKLAELVSGMKFSGVSTQVAQAPAQLNQNAADLEAIGNKLSKMSRSALLSQLQSVNVTGTSGRAGGYDKGDQDALVKAFRGLQGDFRSCYEKALLQDSTIAVTVQMESEVLASGMLSEPALQIDGHTSSEGSKIISDCIKGVFRKVHLDRKLSGIRFRNQVIFKS
jgi:hypothetical protein